jgi:hypothetical protein
LIPRGIRPSRIYFQGVSEEGSGFAGHQTLPEIRTGELKDTGCNGKKKLISQGTDPTGYDSVSYNHPKDLITLQVGR